MMYIVHMLYLTVSGSELFEQPSYIASVVITEDEWWITYNIFCGSYWL